MDPQLSYEENISLVWQSQIVRYTGVSALVFLLWDIIVTFDDELQYIWPQSRSSPTKWVFLFTRYFGAIAQARLVSLNLSLIPGMLTPAECRMLYISQVVFGGTLMACIQALLMLRVYALYTQDRRIAIAMATLLVAELGSMPATIHLTLPDAVGNMCMKPITIRDIALFGASAILPQIIVLGLTVVRFLSGLRAGWGKIPIVSRLVRDDLILVTVIVVWVIITSSLTSMSNAYGYGGYNWLLSLLPCVGCRVVINIQRLADETVRSRHPNDGQTSTPQFTSLIMDAVSESMLNHNHESHSLSAIRPTQTLSFRSSSIKSSVRDTHSHSHSHSHVDSLANSYTSNLNPHRARLLRYPAR